MFTTATTQLTAFTPNGDAPKMTLWADDNHSFCVTAPLTLSDRDRLLLNRPSEGLVDYLLSSFFQNRTQSQALKWATLLMDTLSTMNGGSKMMHGSEDGDACHGEMVFFCKVLPRLLFLQDACHAHAATCVDDSQSVKTDDDDSQSFTKKRKVVEWMAEDVSKRMKTHSTHPQTTTTPHKCTNVSVSVVPDLLSPYCQSIRDKLMHHVEELNRNHTTSMEDVILGTEKVACYNSDLAYQYMMQSIGKNPYNYHNYFQLFEVYRLLNKKIEINQWIRVGIQRTLEELAHLKFMVEFLNMPIMDIPTRLGQELKSTFSTLVTKTEAIHHTLMGCLHYYTYSEGPCNQLYKAIDTDPQCFYGLYMTGAMTGFLSLPLRNHCSPQYYFESAVTASKKYHAFGFRGIISESPPHQSEMMVGNMVTLPFVLYMSAVLKGMQNNDVLVEVMSILEEALTLSPDMVIVLTEMYGVNFKLGHLDLALSCMVRMLHILELLACNNPQSISERSRAAFNIGCTILEDTERKKQAVDMEAICRVVQEAIEICPTNLEIMEWLCGLADRSEGPLCLTVQDFERIMDQVAIEHLSLVDVKRYFELRQRMYRHFGVLDKAAKWQQRDYALVANTNRRIC